MVLCCEDVSLHPGQFVFRTRSQSFSYFLDLVGHKKHPKSLSDLQTSFLSKKTNDSLLSSYQLEIAIYNQNPRRNIVEQGRTFIVDDLLFFFSFFVLKLLQFICIMVQININKNYQSFQIIDSNMGESNRIKIGLLLLICIQMTVQVHFMTSDQYMTQRFNELYTKQKSFEKNVDGVMKNITKLEDKIAKTQNNTEKAMILESALVEERKQIYGMSNILQPSFALSKYTCDTISEDQKNKLLAQIASTRQDLAELKNITNMIKPCRKLTQIEADMAKQSDFLDHLQNVLNTQCKDQSDLVEGAIQSNVYAKNWILGPQTIDQLIDSYAERSLLFDNVTNCPLQFPFFDGKMCMQCPASRPIFNMYTKVCQQCKFDTQIDNDVRRCVQKEHYSNYVDGSNYNLDGLLTLPQIDPQKSPCPKETPFFNGSRCTVCYYPNYWSVSNLQCNGCEEGKDFDINLHECVTASDKKLTVLQNTNWVTDNGDTKRVYDQRKQIIKLNQTSKDYTYCNFLTPFYDGMACAICPNQFNVDQRKCSRAPQGFVYNPNTHTYTLKQQNRETNLNGGKYVAEEQIVDNPSIQDCPIERPFYDGFSCIQCQQPKDIFDIDANQCVVCSQETIYNETGHTCSLREKIYLSTKNLDGLMATNGTSLAQYQQEVNKKVNDNPTALFIDCNQTQYSDFVTCFSCEPGKYFNVQTKKCDACDGSLDEQTHKCKPKVYLFTNLNASKITNLDTPKQQQAQKIKLFLETHPTSRICPIETPYSNNKSCIVCPKNKLGQEKLFDYNTGKCIQCERNTMYVAKSDKCESFIFVSNLNANNYLLTEGKSMDQVQSQEQQIKNNSLTKTCPIETPFTVQGQNCISCSNVQPYFDPFQKRCTGCKLNEYYSVSLKECIVTPYVNSPKANNFLQYGNATYSKFIEEQEDIIKTGKYGICPENSPYSTGTSCVSCGDDSPHFNLSSRTCVSCPEQLVFIDQIHKCLTLVFLTDLSNKFLIEEDNYTVENEKKIQQKLKQSSVTSKCLKDHPYATESQCISCDDQNQRFFNLKTQACQGCQSNQKYIAQLRKCLSVSYLTDLSTSNLIQTNQTTIENLKTQQVEIKRLQPNAYKQCSGKTPYATKNECIGCNDSDKPYFNLEMNSCQGCKVGESYVKQKRRCMAKYLLTNQNITSSNYIIDPSRNITLQSLAANNTIITMKSPVEYCPQDKPYSNGQECLSCTGSYFSFDVQACISCSELQYFDKNSHQCFNRVVITNIQKASNYIVTDNVNLELIQQQNAQYDPKTVYVCPADKPFAKNSGCVGCFHQENKYYNLEKQICQNCGQGYYYEQTDFLCQKIVPRYPNLTNPNWIISKGSSDKIYDLTKDLKAVQGAVQCPQGREFYSQKTQRCVSCQSKEQFFNYDLNQCQKCPTSTKFTVNLHKCIKKVGEGTYQTSLKSDNLVYGGKSQQQYQDEYQQNKSKLPGIKDCPAENPYLDNVACVECSKMLPYFNLKYKMCMDCPQDYSYDSQVQECLNTQGQAVSSPPNPPKMLAQIF